MSSNRPATRSSARQAARHAQSSSGAAGPPTDLPAAPSPARGRKSDTKRKAPEISDASPEQNTSGRRSKRAKVPEQPPPQSAPASSSEPPLSGYSLRKRKQATTMSSPEYDDPSILVSFSAKTNLFVPELLQVPRYHRQTPHPPPPTLESLVALATERMPQVSSE